MPPPDVGSTEKPPLTSRFGESAVVPGESPAKAPSPFDVASGPGALNPVRDVAPQSGNRLSVLERTPELAELLDLPAFSDVCRSLVDLYRIGLKVFDAHGNKLVDFPVGNADFCGYIFTFLQGQRGCTGTVARVKNGPIAATQGARLPMFQADAPKGTITMPCFTGLRYLVMPLTHEGDNLGRVVFGPFWPDDVAELPEGLAALGPEFDRARATQYMASIRRANEGTVEKVLGQFAKVLEALIGSGQKSYLTAQVHLEATRESYRELELKNEELEKSNERLKELDRLKSAFLATVSHELRTPLTSIIGYSEMLNEGLAGALSGDQKEYVEIIMEKGETLLALISGILDLTQIEAGKVRLQFEPTDMAEVVRTSLSSVIPQFQKKGVKLSSQVPPMTKRPGLDREKVRQILVNLLSNSLKFTPEGGEVMVKLVPEVRYEGVDAFHVVVSDSGVGIPPAHQSRVFESFYQVDNSSTREYGGAGLGLAIVRSFARAHGGEVKLTSDEGKGSTFTVILPYTPRVAAPLRTPFG
jgi:two-component system, NarL family, sensor histidine kinase BarA